MALIYQRPKGYELMVSMLSNFHDFCFTKMMINQFEKLLHMDSDIVMKFFNSLWVTPSIVSEGITLRWDECYEEYLFPSHTSYISEKVLQEELEQVNTELHSEEQIQQWELWSNEDKEAMF